jgi:phytoene dehydrogenase-like protein
MAQRYDVVVIGAGLGGLTAAALLARAGRRVLVIERNTSVGGAASTYKVKDLVVEGALHETSDPRDPADPKHAILQRIGILDALDWVPTGALYELRGGPAGEPFVLPDSFAAAREALATRFPAARAGLAKVLDQLQRAAAGGPDGADANRTVAEVFAREFGDNEAVKYALAGNLALYHDDPRTLAWAFFAKVQGAYLNSGARFIRGGSQRLSNALRRALQAAGGEVLLRRVVTAIKLDADGRPSGLVHQRDGDHAVAVATSTIAANAAPGVLAALLPENVRERFAAGYAGRALSTSLFSATIGLDRLPAEFGLRAYSAVLLPPWMTRFDDYPRGAERVTSMRRDGVPALTIANYGAIASGLGGPPYTIGVLGLDRAANWDGLGRPAFEAQRALVLEDIIAAVDRQFPGLASAVTAKSLNTASSMSSYLNAPQGAIYGFAPVPGGANGNGANGSAQTPIPGLYLASSYSGWGGFTGAIVGGAAAADRILAQDERGS